MIDVVIHRRVSTDAQGESGLGLEAQDNSCAEWCQANDGEPRVNSLEVITSKTPLSQRHVLMDSLNALQKGSVLLVAKLDRLSRGDILEMAMIEKLVQDKGARIVSAAGEGTNDDSHGSVFIRRIMGAVAEYERAQIAMRTKVALKAKVNRGEKIGLHRYGKRVAKDGKTVVDDPQQIAIAAKAHKWRTERKLSYSDVADKLNEAGLRTPNSRLWSRGSVEAMLKAMNYGHTPIRKQRAPRPQAPVSDAVAL